MPIWAITLIIVAFVIVFLNLLVLYSCLRQASLADRKMEER